MHFKKKRKPAELMIKTNFTSNYVFYLFILHAECNLF